MSQSRLVLKDITNLPSSSKQSKRLKTRADILLLKNSQDFPLRIAKGREILKLM